IALVVGALGYGVSVVLDAYALRLVGAAREAAYFATAPFIGALAATVVVGESIGGRDALPIALMAGGVALLLRKRPHHLPPHDEPAQDHAHVHDEHHRSVPPAAAPPGEPHAHPHRHAPLVHAHQHVSDVHHRHRH